MTKEEVLKAIMNIPTYDELLKENNKSKNNWNELKECLEYWIGNLEHNLSLIYSDGLKQKIDSFKEVLSKMQEIEGGVDNEYRRN